MKPLRSKRFQLLACLLTTLLLAAGCSSDENSPAPTEDEQTSELGTSDPGTPDPDTPDPGTPDPGTPDPGTPDPGTPDPGTPDPVTPDPGTPAPVTPDPGTPDPGTPAPGTPDPGTPDPEASNFTLTISSPVVDITEGQDLLDVPVDVSRNAGFQGNITLSVDVLNETDGEQLTRQFSDSELSNGEQSSNLQLQLATGPKPLMQHSRTLIVSASDNMGNSVTSELTLRIQPTSAPDIYLLLGQSNMVGISEQNARQSEPGGLDEPMEAIQQLNVTFNDGTNFQTPQDFTDRSRLINTGSPLNIALDPLHEGLQSDGTKSGTRIGMGLSFAKRAIADTTTSIFLVPAAWSDTGFCSRGTNILPGLGWNATEKTDPAFSGTLLHDRAITRANIALEETGGVLRGILWHQGEADSDNPTCAEMYEANLIEMVQSLRTNIDVDERGAAARGPDADIPFVLGTMSVAGDQTPFSSSKLLVDAAHRNIMQNLAYANVVNNDDLVPPDFSCGGGTCIHFGADALREMGVRYYERLLSILE